MAKNGDEAKEPGTYLVGYGKPPRHSRFKKGQSGNPQGRPIGSLNLASVLLKTLREKVVIHENGKRRVITKLEASLKQLVNKATAGDLRALSHLIGVTIAAEQSAAEESAAQDVLNELDREVMTNMIRRYSQSIKGVNEDEKTSN